MKITALKTKKVMDGDSLVSVLNHAVKKFPEKGILAVASKIISICEGRIAKIENKKRLIEKEAGYFIPPKKNKYGITLTITRGMLIPSAGIDESNGNGSLILWPKDPGKAANEIRTYLMKRFKRKNVGIIITDSTTTPLRWGTTGIALAHSGFAPLKNYIGAKDLFGKKMRVTKANIAGGLAAAAVVAMGEGKEQTPLAIIRDVPFVVFQKQNPTQKELKALLIKAKDDLYAPLLTAAKWKKRK